MADQYAFLRVAGDVDRRGDAVDRRFFLVAVDLDFAAVGDLLVVEFEDLFADDFRCEETQRLVRQRLFRVERRTFGQQGEDGFEQPLDIEVFLGRCRYDLRFGQLLPPLVHQRVERFGRREVDLVDHHDGRNAAFPDAADDFGRTVALLHGVGDVEDDVGVGHGAGHEFHHRLLQFVTGFEDARRVGVDDLEIFAGDDAHDAVARGLRLGGDDRQFFADQSVHQCRFSDIGISDDIYKARFVHFLSGI